MYYTHTLSYSLLILYNSPIPSMGQLWLCFVTICIFVESDCNWLFSVDLWQRSVCSRRVWCTVLPFAVWGGGGPDVWAGWCWAGWVGRPGHVVPSMAFWRGVSTVTMGVHPSIRQFGETTQKVIDMPNGVSTLVYCHIAWGAGCPTGGLAHVVLGIWDSFASLGERAVVCMWRWLTYLPGAWFWDMDWSCSKDTKVHARFECLWLTAFLYLFIFCCHIM